MKTVTVFTPTYNRSNLLVNAYRSLVNQTCKDFEWLIVDDGSVDDTENVIASFINEGILDIRYFYQENRGQYYAHNTAAKYAESELFTFLDSDDTYTSNAIERILFYYSQIKEDILFAGVAGLKADSFNRVVGGDVDYNIIDCSILDYRYKYCYKGDKLECFKTDLIKQYLFPEFQGKHVPNALIWNRISSVRKMRYFAEIMHHYDWSEDSMSKTIVQNRQSTPDAYLLYYSELSNYDIPVWHKVRSGINYWRFALYSKNDFFSKMKTIGMGKSIITFFPGMLFCLKDYIICRNRFCLK